MIGAVYSARTGRIRSIVVPNPGETANISLLSGERLEQFSDLVENALPDVGTLQAQLSAITGLKPTGDRYAIVDVTGNVTGALIADPDCGDSVPGCQLIASDVAGAGWTYAAGQFTTPPAPPDPPASAVAGSR